MGVSRGVWQAFGPTVLVVGLLAGVPAGTGKASVAEQVDCAGLQDALANPEIQVVTLAEGEHCFGQFFLPSRAIRLEGAGTGAVLDGGLDEGRVQILSGDDVGQTVIRNLTFRNGHATGLGSSDGGAISVTGASPITIESSTFLANEADGSGGAVSAVGGTAADPIVLRGNIFGSVGAPNKAGGSGGAVYVSTPYSAVFEDNTLRGNEAASGDGGGLFAWTGGPVSASGNVIVGNRAGDYGGGASLEACAGGILAGNSFASNVVKPGGRGGGGLALAKCDHDSPAAASRPRSNLRGSDLAPRRLLEFADEEFAIHQSGNRFTANVIRSDLVTDVSGAGELMLGPAVRSTNDRFVGNRIEASSPGSLEAEARGAGLFVDPAAANLSHEGADLHFDGRNLVVAANWSFDGLGAGMYIGSHGEEGIQGRLVHATVVANSPGGVAGEFDAGIDIDNSIVHGNAGGDLTGFSPGGSEMPGPPAVRFSLLCSSGAPHGGEGNLCADPRLRSPGTGDVHQKATSPTIDRGSPDLVPAGLEKDYEGNSRRLDGDGKSGARVDMGADESPTVYCIVPRLRGLTVPDAKTALSRAHCALGSVRRTYSSALRKGRVLSQSRAAGAKLAGGTKVNVVVSRGRRP